jgi:hypothetical protein
LCRNASTGSVAAGEQHGEFFAAAACGKVDLSAQHLGQRTSAADECLVAGELAIGIVAGLDRIDVTHQHGQ